MQETQVQSLIQEDPTCHRATKPVRLNYWACSLEQGSCNYWAHGSQPLKPMCPGDHAPQQEKPLQWGAYLYARVAMKYAHPSHLVLKHKLSVTRIELELTLKQKKSQIWTLISEKEIQTDFKTWKICSPDSWDKCNLKLHWQCIQCKPYRNTCLFLRNV